MRAVADDATAMAIFTDVWIDLGRRSLGGFQQPVGATDGDEGSEIILRIWRAPDDGDQRDDGGVSHMFPVAPIVVCLRRGQPATLDKAMFCARSIVDAFAQKNP